jgi:hypothetical protein
MTMTVSMSAEETFVSEVTDVASWTYAIGTWFDVSDTWSFSAIESWVEVPSQTVVWRASLVYRTFYFSTYQTIRAYFWFQPGAPTPPPPTTWSNALIIGFVTGALAVALSATGLVMLVRKRKNATGVSVRWTTSGSGADLDQEWELDSGASGENLPFDFEVPEVDYAPVRLGLMPETVEGWRPKRAQSVPSAPTFIIDFGDISGGQVRPAESVPAVGTTFLKFDDLSASVRRPSAPGPAPAPAPDKMDLAWLDDINNNKEEGA